jgi:hypothetical protein
MPSPRKPRQGKRKPRGRPEEPLVIEGNWKDAVKGALTRGKPPAKAPVKKRIKGT